MTLLIKKGVLVKRNGHVSTPDEEALTLQHRPSAGHSLYRVLSQFYDGPGASLGIRTFVNEPPHDQRRPTTRRTHPMLNSPDELRSSLSKLNWSVAKFVTGFGEDAHREGRLIFRYLVEYLEKIIERRQAALDTFLCIKEVVAAPFQGVKYPPSDIAHDVFAEMDFEKWAAQIAVLARAWKSHPGRDEFRDRPAPTDRPGYLAGEAVFMTALETESVDAIIKEIESQRTLFASSQVGRSGQMDECGIWGYFRSMCDLHGGYNWKAAKVQRPASAGPVPEPTSQAADESQHPCWRRNDDMWTVRFGRRTFCMRHFVGMEYIQVLLLRKGEPVEVSKLDRHRELAAADASIEDCAIDATAKREIKQRLEELISERETATKRDDEGAIREVDKETSRLRDHLLQSTDMRGRSRRLGRAQDKVRLRVAGAIKTALRHIKAKHPELAEHLRSSIRSPTGYSPCYDPSEDIAWLLS